MSRRLRRRGQNLVLLALTMLFLALMVTMTLGLGLRIRQKQELQHLADAAAYSNAVMTARTFNNMALINRLQVSYWVAQAADQSLISWTAYGRALSAGAHDAAGIVGSSACGQALPPGRRADLNGFRSDVANYIASEFGGGRQALWRELDAAAGRESRNIQGTISGLRSQLTPGVVSQNPGNLRDELFRNLETQQLTTQILAMAQQPDVSIVDVGTGRQPNTAAQVSMREVDCDYGASGNGPLTGASPTGSGLCLRATINRNMLEAAMGTRGHSFLTGRSELPDRAAGRLAAFAANRGVSVAMGGKSGSAYWAVRKTHGAASDGTEAWGDDHGSVTVSAGGCSASVAVTSHVKSTHLLETGDEHRWSPRHVAGEVAALEPEPDVEHTMGDCTPLCPSVWVRTIGFEPGNTAEDAWGQPKVMVALQRDLTFRPFPWELHFSFPFSATGAASEWDARGHRITSATGRGLNISLQTALSTGIAYYHRRDHWDEFPNLLNPFWRATLAAQDIDATGPNDVRRILSAPGHRWQRDAWQALRANGYEGLH